MEGKKNRLVLFCIMLQWPFVDSDPDNCPEKQHKSLDCLNDFNSVITCTWNSASMSATPGQVCKLHAARIDRQRDRHRSSCDLKVSRTECQRCSMFFNRNSSFQMNHVYNLTLTCPQMSFSMNYTPYSHVKPNPPSQLSINLTTVSWLSQLDYERHLGSMNCLCEWQWKQEDQPWRESSVSQRRKKCNSDRRIRDEAELHEDELVRGEMYQMRVRMMCGVKKIWSDWSPTASWVSAVGNQRPTPSLPPPDANTLSHLWIIVFLAATVCCVTLILFWSKKDKWLYILKKVNSPALPDPGKSFLKDVNFQKGMTPYFSPELFHTALRPVEIMEHVACVTPLTIITERFHESSSSGFSNPSYSNVCSSPLPPMTAGNLVPCPADSETHVGKVNVQELLKMIFNKPAGLKEFKLEKVEAGAERDLSSKTHDDIQRFFAGGVFRSESIQICSAYKPVSSQQDDHMELPSLDSGVGSESEDVSHKDDVDVPLLASSPCFLPAVAGLSPAEKMQILEKMAAVSGSVDPSGDGYKPVRQSD
ncbi:uncharacterized protein LOC128754305 [Synchiropus splendidus]|uniref:uncharacterized protein LOC128754305 n=1 Tax=Synchiropus splendidus TaxID=270530 RepID=UPI00237EC0CF|nr:uncharacterized protein LOC128754305 [Synchiropus splendidus]XP_053712800.1 uncharacterized protein LOC128754305 [Synchiropus splendidus]